jgi:very-short-patch-repair endonuclease
MARRKATGQADGINWECLRCGFIIVRNSCPCKLEELPPMYPAEAKRKAPGGGSKLEAKVAADLAARGLMEGCERQYKFHPTRKWAADFAWPDTKVILEVNGGTYLQGAHSRGSRQRKDYEKWTSISLMGWRLILVDTVDVRKGIHVIRVLEAQEKRLLGDEHDPRPTATLLA